MQIYFYKNANFVNFNSCIEVFHHSSVILFSLQLKNIFRVHLHFNHKRIIQNVIIGLLDIFSKTQTHLKLPSNCEITVTNLESSDTHKPQDGSDIPLTVKALHVGAWVSADSSPNIVQLQ